MQQIKIHQTVTEQPTTSFALFDLGFRPFFWCASVSAVLYMVLWLIIFSRGITLNLPYPAIAWHQHEMIFGYIAAVIAGFLITSVQNWTQQSLPTGFSLAALVSLWLAGRIVPWFDLPLWLGSFIDLTFLPVLMVVISIPILRSRQWRNILIPAMIFLMVLTNLIVHAPAFGLEAMNINGHQLALGLVIALILVFTGRLIPFFSQQVQRTNRLPLLKINRFILHGAVISFILAKAFFPEPWLIIALSLLAGGALSWRTFRWYFKEIWSEPLLWVLHLGCVWIVIGFALEALASANLLAAPLALHAFTVGGIGLVTLGMMVRVSLGHTGRSMHASTRMFWALILINLATLIRVFMPLALPDQYLYIIMFSGGLWSLAFGLFVWEFTPVLFKQQKINRGLLG